MSQRRTSPLLIGAIVLAVITPLGFAAWMVRGAKREAEEEARAALAPAAPAGARTILLRPGGPPRPTMAPPAVKLAAPPVPADGEAGQMAAIDRAARAQAAAQAGLTPEE